MASGTLDADKINKEKSKWEAGNKVYTRRPKKGIHTTTAAASLDPPVTTTFPNPPVTTASPDPPATTASPPPPATTTSSPPPATTTSSPPPATTASPAPPATTASPSPPATSASPAPPVTEVAPASPITTANDEQTLTNEDANLQREETLPQVSDDSSGQSLGHGPVPETSGPTRNGVTRPIVTFIDDRVKIYLEASTPKNEIKDLWEKLTGELHQVRNVAQKLQDKEAEITHYSTVLVTTNNNEETYSQPPYSQPQYPGNVTIDRRSLIRVNSEMGPDLIDRRALTRLNSEVNPIANQEMSRFRQLSVSVGDYVEKEKRTPKANQYYRNSDFLLGKDRLPPESNKRQKSNSGRKSDYTINIERHKNQAFRSCSSLLQRLMKHKHGWVFNEPVNAKALGLHDYHDIIKHPMDLGTIKSRLAQSFYKTPGEFAEDVRLTFHNAMTYNPKGQDVHVMAEQLSNIFEERWVVIESDWRYGTVHDTGTPTPTSRNNNNNNLIRSFERSQSMGVPVMSRAKPSIFVPVSRTPVPKKPKAKEPNKRDMTYEEKQKLSANLQNLPSEKLDSIVQIIKKSNTSLSQNDDEIEVDIDIVDVETLWELDRFVTNYKKNLSKHRRKAELSQQARALGGNTNGKTMLQNTATPVLEAPTKEKRADEKSPPENQGNVSSSSSSSSSDSGSSSSDSDSDSSSDAGQ